MSLKGIVISGAIISSFGTALLITFVVVLLVFPVQKECNLESKCEYNSQAPEPYSQIVQQSFLAAALLAIAAGVVMIRVARWLEFRQAEPKTGNQ